MGTEGIDELWVTYKGRRKMAPQGKPETKKSRKKSLRLMEPFNLYIIVCLPQ